MAMSAIVDQWEVQYARSTSPATAGGVWSSTSPAITEGALLKTIAGGSSDYVLNLTVRGTVLEEHRVSQLNFTWPQVSCVSGFPARGTRAVFVSFKDAPDQVQKFGFGLYISTMDEAERFFSLLKKIMVARGDQDATSYFEMPSVEDEPPYRSEESLRNTISADASNCEGQQSLSCEDRAVTMEAKQGPEPEEYHPVFPPSSTSLLKDCYPEPEQVKPSFIQEVEHLELKNEVMEIMGARGDLDAKSYSKLSSQSEYMPSVEDEPLYMSEESLRDTISADASNFEGHQSFSCEDRAVTMEAIHDPEHEEYHLKDGCSEPKQVKPSVTQEVEQLELKNKVMQSSSPGDLDSRL